MVALTSVQSTLKLRDGNEIPILGFGTYEMEGQEAYKAVTWALEAGYRHIDSAAWYENEREVGQAILDFCRATSTARSAVFYTTKLKLNNGYANVRASIQRSLDVCGLGYIDLYLIHGPLGGVEARRESWRAVCDMQKELGGSGEGGKLRSVGVSTFGLGHLREILEAEGVPVPAVHQIDLHPFMARTEIVELCRKYDITLEAWAPLVRGFHFDHPAITALAHKYSKEPAQILLRYSLQKGYVPLPKSSSRKRIIANTQLFDFALSEEEVARLDKLDEALVTDWEPTMCP